MKKVVLSFLCMSFIMNASEGPKEKTKALAMIERSGHNSEDMIVIDLSDSKHKHASMHLDLPESNSTSEKSEEEKEKLAHELLTCVWGADHKVHCYVPYLKKKIKTLQDSPQEADQIVLDSLRKFSVHRTKPHNKTTGSIVSLESQIMYDLKKIMEEAVVDHHKEFEAAIARNKGQERENMWYRLGMGGFAALTTITTTVLTVLLAKK